MAGLHAFTGTGDVFPGQWWGSSSTPKLTASPRQPQLLLYTVKKPFQALGTAICLKSAQFQDQGSLQSCNK